MAKSKHRVSAKHRRSQTALEYLTSYAWAILIIAVVTALFYLYIQTPSALPSTCTFVNGFYCRDIILQSNTMTHNTFLTVALTNSQAYAIGNPKLYVGLNMTNTTTFSCSPQFILPGGSVICTANVPVNTNLGVLLSGDMYLNATYCGLLGNYIYTSNCVGGPKETYHGTFTGHTETQISTTPSITITVANSTQRASNGKDPLYATVRLNGYQISGATVNFTVNNQAYTITPSLTDTNSSGVALSYIWGTSVGSAVITATYAGLSNSVTVQFITVQVSTSTSTTVPTVPTSTIIAMSAPSVTPSSPTIDLGQAIALTAIVNGGIPTYTYQWYTGASCASSIIGQTGSGYLTTPSSTTTYSVMVTDSSPSSICSAGDTVTVNGALSAGAITPSSPFINNGQQVTLNANPSGGTPSYSYTWYTGAGCTSPIGGAISSSYVAQPSSTTTYYYQVTDSATNPNTACSAGDTITVNPVLFAGQLSPSNPSIDLGQSVTLNTNPSGGSGTYTSYAWYSNAGCTTSASGVSGANPSVNPTVTTTYYYTVTDSVSTTSSCSAGDTVAVNSPPLASAITPAAPTIDNGQSVTLTAHPTLGSGSYAYQWYTGTACQTLIGGATGSTYGASPSSTTGYSYKLTDSAYSPESVCSAVDTVTVNPTLLANPITPSAPSIDNTQSITLTANPTGGTGTITYLWYTGTACQTSTGVTTSTYSPSPSSTTGYSYKVTDQAYSPASICSAVDTVTVNPTLTVGAVTPAAPTIDNTQSITLTANPSGGSGTLTYLWYTGTACQTSTGVTTSTYSPSPSSTTGYSYKVTDQAYSPASICSAVDTVTVNPTLTAGAVTPASPQIDNGQGITLTANPTGGSGTLSYQWYTGAGCASPLGVSTSTYTPSPPSTITYYYKVTDQAYSPASACSAGDTVTVNPALGANPVTPAAPTIDNTQSITLTANPTGGTPSYTYLWYTGTACQTSTGVTTSTYSPSPSSTTGYSYKVTDAESYFVCSAVDTVTVNPTLTAGAVTPAAPTIDNTQSITLTANPTGGTGTITYLWYTGTACQTSTGVTTSTYSPSPSSTTGYSYKVTDQAYSPASICSAVDTVTVNPTLTVGAVTPAAPTIDKGQSITLTSAASGGSGTLSYQWYTGTACASSITSATSSTLGASPSSTTGYSYKVTDQAYSPASICSAVDTVTVNPTLAAGAITPSSPTLDNTQSITLASNPSGGSGTLTYLWYTGTACQTSTGVTTSTYSPSPSSTTGYSYKVTDQAYSPASICSAVDTATVDPVLVAGAITATNTIMDNGQSTTLTSAASGGTPSYTINWFSAASCPSANYLAQGTAYSATPSSSTTYSYNVVDSATTKSSVCSAGTSITVNPALVAGTLTESNTVIDNGQYSRLTGNPSGGTVGSGYTLNYFSQAACAGSSFASGASTLVNPSSTTTYSYNVVDSATTPRAICSAANTVNVNGALFAGPITPASPSIDNGQSVTLNANPSGGTGTYTSYSWYTNVGCTTSAGLSGASPSASPSSTTTYYYTVTDSALSTSACSAGDTVTVYPTLSGISISPASQTHDPNQAATSLSITITSGGSNPSLSYLWYSYTSTSCPATGGSIGSSSTYSPSTSTAGTYYYCVKVSDGEGGSAYAATGATVIINSVLGASAPTASTATIDNGQSTTLTANPSGGSGTYSSYAWYTNAGCSTSAGLAATSPATASPAATTTYYYTVTDSLGVTSACSSGLTITVYPTLSGITISPTTQTKDQGQGATALSISVSSGGSNPSLTYLWYSYTSTSCPATGTSIGSSSTYTPSTGSAGTSYYCVKVSDGEGGSAYSATGATVIVNSAPTAGAPTASSNPIDNGQSTTLTSHPSGGSGSYSSYLWYTGASACQTSTGVTTATYAPSPAATTTYYYTVTDSLGATSACSAGLVITVYPTLSGITISPTTQTKDQGQGATALSITITSGGSNPSLTYLWYSYTSTSCPATGTSIGSSSTYTPSTGSAGTSYYCVKVSDGEGGSAYSATGATVIVNSAPTAGAPTASSNPIDNGQSTTLTSHPSGGSGSYSSYLWYTGASACQTSTGVTTATYAPSPAATTTYYYTVTDSLGATSACSAGLVITVYPTLSGITISPTTQTKDQGQGATALSITITSGGSNPSLTYLWYSYTSTSCPATGTSIGSSSTYTPSTGSAGTSYYCVKVSDGEGGSAYAATGATVVVNTAPTGSAPTASVTTIDNGQSTTLTAHPSGGSGSYSSYAWYTNAGCSTSAGLAATSPATATPASTTTYYYTVTDSLGATSACSSGLSITVNSDPTAGAITPASPTIPACSGETLTAHPSGGSGSFPTYAWYTGSTSCATVVGGQTASTYTPSPCSTTTYWYKATDSLSYTTSCSAGDTVSATTSSSSTSSTSSSTSSTTSVAWVYCHGIDLYDQCYGWYCNGPPNPSCPSGCPTCTYYTCGTGSFGGGSVDYQQTDCGSYTTSTIATVSSTTTSSSSSSSSSSSTTVYVCTCPSCNGCGCSCGYGCCSGSCC